MGKRRFKNMSTLYKVIPPNGGKNHSYAISGRTDEVLRNIRTGGRPSLIGKIDGLNSKMEAAFRTGRFVFTTGTGHIVPQWTACDGTLFDGAKWTELGLPERPVEAEKEAAFSAQEAWRRAEVFPFDGKGVQDLAEAQAAFEADFGRFHVGLRNARSAEEIEHIGHLLHLFAPDVLERGLMSTIDLEGGGAGGFFKYEIESRALYLNDSSRWDRYLFTKNFVAGLGYAAFGVLTHPQINNSLLNLLIECNDRHALFVSDPTGPGPEELFRLSGFPGPVDGFAMNYMRFQLMAEGMASKFPDIRNKLYSFYAQFFPSVAASPQPLI